MTSIGRQKLKNQKKLKLDSYDFNHILENKLDDVNYDSMKSGFNIRFYNLLKLINSAKSKKFYKSFSFSLKIEFSFVDYKEIKFIENIERKKFLSNLFGRFNREMNEIDLSDKLFYDDLFFGDYIDAISAGYKIQSRLLNFEFKYYE